MDQDQIATSHAYRAGLLLSFSVIGLLNFFHLLRPATCADCFFPYGVPFTLFREGGFAGRGGVVWSGLIADFIVALLLGMMLGRMLVALHILRQRMHKGPLH